MSKIEPSNQPENRDELLGFSALLENRPFVLLWFNQVLTQASLAFLNFSLFLWVFEITKSNSMVSLVVLSIFASSIIFSILAGVLADQVSRRNIIMISNFCRAILTGLFLVIPTQIFWIIGLSFLVNSVAQFYFPAEAAIIPTLVTKNDLLTANSMFAFTMYLAMIGGFIVAGPMIDLFGFRSVFALSSIFTLTAIVFVVRLPACVPADLGKKRWLNLKKWLEATWEQVKQGLEFISGNSRVKAAFLIGVGLNGMIGLVSSLAPGFAVEILHVNATSASYVIMAPAGTGLLAGALMIGRFGQRAPKRLLVTIGTITGGIILFLMGFLPSVGNLGIYQTVTLNHLPRQVVTHMVNLSGLISALAFFLGLVAVMVIIPSQTVLQEQTPDQIRGRVFGAFGILVYGASSVPTLIGAQLADLLGLGTMIMSLGFLVFLAGLLGRRAEFVRKLLEGKN